MLNIFVTSTNNNTGKTFLSAGIAATMQSLNYSTCIYKPVQTGVIEKNGFAQASDTTLIKSVDPYIKTASSYFLKQKTVPIIAAENENIIIDKNIIKNDFEALSKNCDCTIVEGAGGIMTPLCQDFLTKDMINFLGLPLIIVVKPESGALNHTLLTINAAVASGINVRGVIINDFPDMNVDYEIKALPRLIEEYSDVKILGVIPHFDDIKKLNPNDFITHILNGIDIESVFDVRIAKLDVD